MTTEKFEVPVAVGWKVIIDPKPAKIMSDQGIDMSATEDAQEHLVYLGTLIAIGEAAFTANTQGGINMAEWKVRPRLGDFVMFSPYSGMRIRPRGKKTPIILMNDTDIQAIIGDMDSFYSWIDA